MFYTFNQGLSIKHFGRRERIFCVYVMPAQNKEKTCNIFNQLPLILLRSSITTPYHSMHNNYYEHRRIMNRFVLISLVSLGGGGFV